MHKIILKISGMHCASCEKIISMTINELSSIKDIKIDHLSGHSEITFDNTQTDSSSILDKIKTTGYDAKIIEEKDEDNNNSNKPKNNDVKRAIVKKIEKPSPLELKIETKIETHGLSAEKLVEYLARLVGNTTNPIQSQTKDNINQPIKISEASSPNQQINLAIEGMHCVSCANIIEKEVKKLPGIKSININLTAAKGRLIFDRAKINENDIIKTIKHAGYNAQIINKNNTKQDRQRSEKEIKNYWHKFLWSLGLSLPMFYFMLFDFFPWFPGQTVMPYIGIISLILTLPVQFIVGAGFIKDFGAV